MRKTGKMMACKLCKKLVYMPAWRQKGFKFCSKICAAKVNFTGSNHYNWQGGRQKHGDGYMQIYKPEHPSSDSRHRVMEHRYIMEIYLGRILSDDEHVHHINGNKLDNRIENLMIMSNSEHLKHEWKYGVNMKNASKGWIKKGQHLSRATEFKKL
jgi:hypothetical protein